MTQVVDKKVNMTLVGQDGNAFFLMAAFAKNAGRQGWSRKEIDLVLDKARSGDYDNLLCTLMDHINDDVEEDDPDFEDDWSEGEDDEDFEDE
jgi:hypothetical protein